MALLNKYNLNNSPSPAVPLCIFNSVGCTSGIDFKALSLNSQRNFDKFNRASTTFNRSSIWVMSNKG